jgi:hypothetical protein
MALSGLWRLLFALSCAAMLSSCVAPARSFGAYEGKAATTAEDALSAVETARLAVGAAAKRDAFAPYLSVVLGEAEDAASSVQGTFDSVQPPDSRSDQLRQDLDDRLQAAVSVLSDLRIAVRRGEARELPSRLEDLTKAADALRAFHEAHS